MAAGVEAVRFEVRDVGVYHGDRDEAFTSVEDLYVQAAGVLTDGGVDEVTRLDVATAKGESDVCGGLEVIDDIGYDLHLLDSLYEDFASVFSPLAVC